MCFLDFVDAGSGVFLYGLDGSARLRTPLQPAWLRPASGMLAALFWPGGRHRRGVLTPNIG